MLKRYYVTLEHTEDVEANNEKEAVQLVLRLTNLIHCANWSQGATVIDTRITEQR